MGSIWKPTVQTEPYRGNVVRHREFWTPTQTNELYHYGRKGMKWYKSIFGKIKLPNMGGVGGVDLLNKEKIEEIAKKLGIPVDQISKRMSDIREYFAKERQEELRSANTNTTTPAYDKTQKDSKELKSIVERVARNVKEGERQERMSREYVDRKYYMMYGKRQLKRSWEKDIKKQRARDQYEAAQKAQQQERERKEAQQRAKDEAELEELRKADEKSKRDYQAYKEKAAKENGFDSVEEYDAYMEKERKRSEEYEAWKQKQKDKIDAFWKRQAEKEEAKRKKEEEKLKALAEAEEEQRKREEEERQRYIHYMQPNSGGGHKF